MNNRPNRRPTNITGKGKKVGRRGDGLGTGPVGNPGGYTDRPGTVHGNSSSNNPQTIHSTASSERTGMTRAGKTSLLSIIAVVAVVLIGSKFLGGGNLLGNLLGSSSGTETASSGITETSSSSGSFLSNALSGLGGNLLSSFGSNLSGSGVSSGWARTANTGKLDTSVTSGARAKYTSLRGNGKDTVTIMVYMCGADLESQGGMATSDLMEMTAAKLSDKINLLVYTGGAKAWKNNVVSNKVNQIYRVTNGGLTCLEADLGSKPMTDPASLTSYIQYAVKNYPADRNVLIFWDHGGGSLSGYGYDEKFASSGSMTLKGIDQALKNAKTKFDFIGFDACLMATVENALMLSDYADYMIASEETEPGIGWYYTDWLNQLSSNTSESTLEIGKTIADTFVDQCGKKCAGQKTTLSVVDLAELAKTVPDGLSGFASSTLDLMQNNNYQTVSDARSGAREFAAGNGIDQIDLVSLSCRLGTDGAKDLVDTILGAVKYNRTSSNMTDAYGLSIYFPYQKTSGVSQAVATYEAIGMDDEYARCIQKFASMEVGGQAVAGGTSSALPSLLGSLVGGTSGSGSGIGGDMISSLLGSLVSGGSTGGILDLLGGDTSFLGRGLDPEQDAEYLAENRFDTSALVWQTAEDGTPVMLLPEEQWNLVQELELNVFIDDGEGFIDLGFDNNYAITETGALVGDYAGTWLAVDDQPVAYYYTDTVVDGDDMTITGRIPALLNGSRVNLIVVFDPDHPNGFIAGAEPVYDPEVTTTVSKALLSLEDGDVIDFLCDYYNYDGTYEDSYMLGDAYTVSGTPVISDVYLDADALSACYRFTDIYHQHYWTPVLP